MATIVVKQILLPYIKNKLINATKEKANDMLISMFSTILTNAVIGDTSIIEKFNKQSKNVIEPIKVFLNAIFTCKINYYFYCKIIYTFLKILSFFKRVKFFSIF